MKHMSSVLLVALCLGSGCTDPKPDRVAVRVCGDLVVPDELDSVRLTVMNEDRTEIWSGLIEVAATGMNESTGDAGTGTSTILPRGVDAGPDPGLEDPGINAGWLGGPCVVPEDCGHSRAACLTDGDGYPNGMCTLECARSCPDRANTPKVFCALDVLPDGGGCVQLCDEAAFPETGCRPGYACTTGAFFEDPSTEERICLPVSQVEPPAAPDMGPVDVPVDAGLVESVDAVAPDGPRISVSRNVPIPDGSGWVRAQGLKDGIVVITGEVRPGRSGNIPLDRQCLRVTCPTGQTCVNGQCDLVPIGGTCP